VACRVHRCAARLALCATCRLLTPAGQKGNAASSALPPQMYIYVCIKPGARRRAMTNRPLDGTADPTGVYGTPQGFVTTVLQPGKISEKLAQFFATSRATLPCARMHIIHFSGAVMHERWLARLLRHREKSSRRQREMRRISDRRTGIGKPSHGAKDLAIYRVTGHGSLTATQRGARVERLWPLIPAYDDRVSADGDRSSRWPVPRARDTRSPLGRAVKPGWRANSLLTYQ
jgi:hypothetical protein